MATALQNLIDAYIKRNANQEITGPVLNGVLTAIANALGTPFVGSDGYWYTYDADTGQFVKTDTPAQGETGPVGVTSAAASINDQIGTPEVDVNLNGTQLVFTFRNLKGQKGDTGETGATGPQGETGPVGPIGPQGVQGETGDPGITAVVVTVDSGTGTPSVDASISGTTLTLAFHNLKGETGPQGETGPVGPQGNTGVSADYPITIANNLTTDDPTAALAASQGVVLQGEIDQLGQEVNGNDLVFSSFTKTFNIIITGNTWYARGTHRVIPVTPGETYRLKPTGADTNYAWLTASYDPSQITGAAPVLSGTTIVSVTNGTEVIVTVPDGASYLYLMNETSQWVVVSWEIHGLGNVELLGMRMNDVEDIIKSLPNEAINYEILPLYPKSISGTNWYSAGSHRVLAVAPGDVYLLKSILHDTNYAWLTSSYDPSASAGSAAPFVPGTERYTAIEGEPITVTAPENAAYLYLVNENGGWQAQSWEITKIGDISQIKSRLDAIEENLPSGTLLPYYGEKITLSPVYGLRKVSGVTARLNGTLYPQGMAVYGGYMFRVYDTGQCEIYDITGAVPSLVRTFALGCASDSPHCNAVQFANTIESGDFPYLYVSACKTDVRKCYVVSVGLEGNSQLIQTITFAEMDALPSEIAMNTVVGEDGYLWASGYKGTTLYFAKFELPATDAGDLTIGASSLVDSWQVADYDYDNNVNQGMCVRSGRLYYSYGGQFGNRGLWVYDTVQKKKVSELKMNDTTSVEFEDVAIYDGKMYLELVADYYFVLTF